MDVHISQDCVLVYNFTVTLTFALLTPKCEMFISVIHVSLVEICHIFF